MFLNLKEVISNKVFVKFLEYCTCWQQEFCLPFLRTWTFISGLSWLCFTFPELLYTIHKKWPRETISKFQMTSQNLYDVRESTSVLKASFPIWRYDLAHPDMSGTYLMFRRNRYPFSVPRRMVHFGTPTLSSPWKVSDWFGVRLVKVPQRSSQFVFFSIVNASEECIKSIYFTIYIYCKD